MTAAVVYSRRAALMAVAVAASMQVTIPAAAQDGDVDPGLAEADASDLDIDLDAFVLDVEGQVHDVEGEVLDIVATIEDVDGSTGVTESAEETTITLQADVFFDFDSDVLRADAEATLSAQLAMIRDDGADELHVTGHTDSVGDDAYNQGLSDRRAAAVEAFLAAHLDGVTITTEGLGATRPVAPEETQDGQDLPDGRARNRRVEITYPQA